MATNLGQVAGNVEIQGSLTVRGGIANSEYSRIVTKVAESQASLKNTADYANDTPPTNNITGLAIDSEQNTDGSVNVNLSWSYTQGTVKADGFLVYYKAIASDGETPPTPPGPINLESDPATFIAASTTGTSYAHVLPGLPANIGGAGSIPRRYRFAVLPVAIRKSGTVPIASGIVDGINEISGWKDKVFAAAIAASSTNFWDLTTGELRNDGIVQIGDDHAYFGFVPDGETDPVMGTGPKVAIKGSDFELGSQLRSFSLRGNGSGLQSLNIEGGRLQFAVGGKTGNVVRSGAWLYQSRAQGYAGAPLAISQDLASCVMTKESLSRLDYRLPLVNQAFSGTGVDTLGGAWLANNKYLVVSSQASGTVSYLLFTIEQADMLPKLQWESIGTIGGISDIDYPAMFIGTYNDLYLFYVDRDTGSLEWAHTTYSMEGTFDIEDFTTVAGSLETSGVIALSIERIDGETLLLAYMKSGTNNTIYARIVREVGSGSLTIGAAEQLSFQYLFESVPTDIPPYDMRLVSTMPGRFIFFVSTEVAGYSEYRYYTAVVTFSNGTLDVGIATQSNFWAMPNHASFVLLSPSYVGIVENTVSTGTTFQAYSYTDDGELCSLGASAGLGDTVFNDHEADHILAVALPGTINILAVSDDSVSTIYFDVIQTGSVVTGPSLYTNKHFPRQFNYHQGQLEYPVGQNGENAHVFIGDSKGLRTRFEDDMGISVGPDFTHATGTAGGAERITTTSDIALSRFQGHPGVRRVSTTAANGSYHYTSCGHVNSPGLLFQATIQLPADLSTRIVRLGLHSPTTSNGIPTQGVYFKIAGQTLSFNTSTGGVESAVGTTATIPALNWVNYFLYTLRTGEVAGIALNWDNESVLFDYINANVTQTVLWAAEASFGCTASGTNQLADIDYIGIVQMELSLMTR